MDEEKRGPSEDENAFTFRAMSTDAMQASILKPPNLRNSQCHVTYIFTHVGMASCHMSMLRKGHVALSNLRVKSPSLPFFWLFGKNLPSKTDQLYWEDHRGANS